MYASSSTALTEPKPGERKKIKISDWNKESIALARHKDPKPNGFRVYATSKALVPERG